ncbi:MAG: hypothetical protein MUE73_16435 [Planctomycetes bacterium]|jgi:hypothetical protein|nr:hypothetical protein [Planctomycetota bacterium]
MLVIRREQMEAFGLLGSTEYKDFMAAHLTEHFPVHAEVWSPETMLAVIEEGAAAARGHRLSRGRELCLYTDFRVILGAGFDTDPQLPFAGRILADASIRSPGERLDRLYDAVRNWLDAVVGRGQVFPLRPLSGLADFPLSRLETNLSAGITKGILGEFREIWPQKHRQAGEAALREMVDRGIEEAAGHGFTEPRAAGWWLILRYMLGHRCAGDPQYPWLSGTLSDPGPKTPDQRFRLLHSKSKAALADVLRIAT